MKRIKLYNQLTQTECGLCCIAMIASYHSFVAPLSYFRERLEIGRDGTSMLDMVALLQSLNLDVATKKVSSSSFIEKCFPVIAYMNKGHYVVVEKKKNKSLIILDPDKGRLKISCELFDEEFSGYYLVTSPNENFKNKKIKLYEWNPYVKIIKKLKFEVIKVLLLSCLMYVVTMIIPFFIQKIVDTNLMYIHENRNWILVLSILLMVIYLIVSLLKNKEVLNLTLKIDDSLTMGLTNHMLKLPYSFFEQRGASELIFRYNLLPSIRDLLANGILDAVINIGLVVFILIYMFNISNSLCMIAAISLIFIFIYNKFINSKILERNQSELDSTAKFNNVKMETLMEIFSIKTMGLEESTLSKFSDIYKLSLKKFSYRAKLTKFNISILGLFQTFFPFIILIITISFMAIENSISMGELLSIYTLSGLLFSNAITLFQNFSGFYLMKNMMQRLNDIFLEKAEERKGTIEVDEFNSLEFEQVNFSYQKKSLSILNNINFKINKGETVAFVGPSGSGKSTIMKLICSLSTPTSGRILVNDLSLSDVDITSLKKKIGVVPQNASLFNRSIGDNIKLNTMATDEEVNKALRLAELADDVENMPMKLNTLISEFGLNLSGGQKQRIALARAIIHKPELLILDEATSSLDTITESKINNNLATINCTKVIIAHRLSTIEQADKIVVLNNGYIEEIGNHDSLIEKKGLYYSLYKQQEKGNNHEN